MLILELKKTKFLNLLLASIIIPLLANIFGLINYLNNIEILRFEWKSLWTQVTLFYFSFFFIPLIAIVVASLWSVEHKTNLKLIRISPIKNISFIISKGILSLLIIALTQMYFLLLFYLEGKFICHFSDTDFGIYIYYISLSIVLSIPMIFVFQFLAIKIKSLGIIVLLSTFTSILGFALTTQNIFTLLAKVMGLNYLSLELNNGRFINTQTLTLLFAFAIVEIIVFSYLANKSLKYEK
ncbi:MAG: ABC transporter permease [Peptoniphilus sp.]|uniref:ABC transporter permease n=1 Tax=Peptoniphilus sp. TaxID=1971214 RepID=UPI0025F85451|nr:ABC transporter permease [Peptoniphilus sp.]MCI5643258.1 ABC transporter permease [Peptoniphilus sp.]MDD7352595.1 ABC transporter permease [Peptoniphilaceae bacterium]MDY3902998.1 ABC transporter permease [Peptoniphilus sp.]